MQIQWAINSYQARALPLSAQRIVNFYAEGAPKDAKDPVVLYGTPGIKAFADAGDGPIRGMELMDGLLYAVSGCILYSIDINGREISLGSIWNSVEGGVSVSAGATMPASASFEITAGTASSGTNQISSITIDGVDFLGVSVDWGTSNAATAAAVAVQFNAQSQIPKDWSQVGNGLSIVGGAVSVAAMTTSRVAYIDSTNDEIQTYDFDGTDWAQVGNGKSISPAGVAALAALTFTRIVEIDETNAEIRAYDWDGTDWTLKGNGFSLATLNVEVAALTSSRIALAYSGNLVTYDFDGTDWSKVGNALTGFTTTGKGLASLTSSRVAYSDAVLDELRAYDFDGTDWAQVGNGLAFTGSHGNPELTALTSNRVVHTDTLGEEFKIYDFNGTDWIKVGNTFSISNLAGTGISAMTSSRIAFGDQNIDELRTYDLSFNLAAGGWSALAVGAKVLITAPDGTGADHNGEPVVITTAGDVQVDDGITTLEGGFTMPGIITFTGGGGIPTTGLGRKVSMSHNAAGTPQLCIVDGTNGWIYTTTGGLVQITDSDFFSADVVDFQDQYFIFNRAGTGQWFLSNLNDGTVYTATDIATAEGDPDNLVALISNRRELWLFGAETIEIYYNSGNADFPFSRFEGGFLERGLAAAFSIAEDDNSLFWLGEDRIFYRADGYTPQRISQHGIEEALRQYKVVSDACAFIYTMGGHKFYVCTFPAEDQTWVYDITTGLWHERQSFGMGRWRVNVYADAYGKHLVGDSEDGKIGELDLDTYQEYGNTLQGQATGPAVYADRKRIFHSRFELDIEAGVGLTSGQGSDPQVWLEWSDDGGHTWSARKPYRSMGKLGVYRQRLRWLRLGQARQRIYRLTVSDPVTRSIIAAHLDAGVGDH